MRTETNKYIFVTFAITWFGWLFDALDSMIFGMTIPAMIKEWHITPSTIGLIGTCFLLAYAFGDLLFATAADKRGRKPMLMLSVAVYGVFTGLCGLAGSWKQMLIARALTGIGTGGELPVGALIVAEETPAKWRGFALGALISAYPIGYLLAALFNILFSPVYGWRSLYFAGAIPALVLIAFAAVFLKETKRFTQSRIEAARKVVHKRVNILEPIRYSLRNYVVGIVIMFAFLFMWWGWATWVPQFLITEKHLGVLKGSYFIIYYSVFGLPAYFICGYISEKLGRKKALALFMVPAAVLLWVYVNLSSVNALLVVGCITSFFIYGGYAIGITYPSEFFPTRMRGTGYGGSMFIARVLASISPLLIGYIATKTSIAAGLPILSIVFLISALIMYLYAPETSQKELEDIVREKPTIGMD
jgi:putative MFS transporter